MPNMHGVGDVHESRASLHKRWGKNLRYLLDKRLSWMQPYLSDGARAVELGSGAGFSGMFLTGNLELTDTEKRPWIDRVVDALDMPYEDESVDVLIANNMIHHLAKPQRFFDEAARVLKPGGYLLVQEINCSRTMAWVLDFMNHEDYSFEVDPFDPEAVCNDPSDPWSANCALPNLLFDDVERFERHFPAFAVEETGFSEFLVLFNSGGVIARTAYLPLPRWAMSLADKVDRTLIALAPQVFAGQRRVVMRKRARPADAP
jgi:SAM-dependent methyltransferase